MKNLKILNKMLNLRGVALALVVSTATTGLAGCGKKSDCSIDEYHAHKYVDEDGYIRYIDKEYLSYDGYDWSEDYVSLSKDQRKLYDFLDEKKLLKIEDNLDNIMKKQEENVDFIEYRYEYDYLLPIPQTTTIGNVTSVSYIYVLTTHHSWTTDPNHKGLTGEQRLCHYVYEAYKIEKDDKGKFVLIPSSEVDDLTTVMDEYPYIKEKYYKTVDISSGKDLDYEDMKEDDPELIQKNDNIATQDNHKKSK